MPKYKAVLFAPDGEWVTDLRGCDTIEEVQDAVADMGSRWYFYPFCGVIRDNGPVTTSRQRLVDIAEPFEYLSGCSIKTAGEEIARTDDAVLAALLS